MTRQIKALSLTQPWAWLVANGHKDIENRTWRTNYRGWVYIHASKRMTGADYRRVAEFTARVNPAIKLPPIGQLTDLGGIVGAVKIVGCVNNSDSPWWMGPFGFTLRFARPIPFTPCKGALGFFDHGLDNLPDPRKFVLTPEEASYLDTSDL
jgi:hypothetical protein